MSNYQGFFISKIRVSGNGLKNAEVSFEAGFNVVSGLSDTGKSFIFECINYAFGVTKKPREIPESKNYTDVYLEIKRYNDKSVFTIYRSLVDSNEVHINSSPIDGFTKTSQNKYKSKHSKDSDNTLSYFLLDLIGISKKNMKANQRNEKREISFRELLRFVSIDEVRIITTDSPVLTGFVTNKTYEKSIFNYLLTGSDASELIEIEKAEIIKTRLNTRIDFINEMIEEKTEIINNNDTTEVLDVINITLDEMSNKIDNSTQRFDEEMSKKEDLWYEIETSKSAILRDNELINRFKLLDSHYRNDLDRIKFIIEGESLVSQLGFIECPLCHQEMTEDHYQCLDDDKKLTDSLKSESKKIAIKMEDLAKTIKNLELEIEKNDSVLKETTVHYNQVHSEIVNKLNPEIKSLKSEFKYLLQKSEEIGQTEILKSEIDDLYALKSKIEKKLKTKKGTTDDSEATDYSIYLELNEEIKNLLTKWDYPQKFVNLDTKSFDFNLSGQLRNSHGKGIRAILYSSFIIGLMNHNKKYDKPHPQFVILDSPLTTYRGTEKIDDSNENEAPKNIQEAFFKNLAETKLDQQIIIFENKEPPESIANKINHVFFSQDTNVGRYGFFPLK